MKTTTTAVEVWTFVGSTGAPDSTQHFPSSMAVTLSSYLSLSRLICPLISRITPVFGSILNRPEVVVPPTKPKVTPSPSCVKDLFNSQGFEEEEECEG